MASAILYQTYDRLGARAYRAYHLSGEAFPGHSHATSSAAKETVSVAVTYAEKDDVTSPVHIGTAGLTFQIADRTHAAITVA